MQCVEDYTRIDHERPWVNHRAPTRNNALPWLGAIAANLARSCTGSDWRAALLFAELPTPALPAPRERRWRWSRAWVRRRYRREHVGELERPCWMGARSRRLHRPHGSNSSPVAESPYTPNSRQQRLLDAALRRDHQSERPRLQRDVLEAAVRLVGPCGVAATVVERALNRQALNPGPRPGSRDRPESAPGDPPRRGQPGAPRDHRRRARIAVPAPLLPPAEGRRSRTRPSGGRERSRRSACHRRRGRLRSRRSRRPWILLQRRRP